MAFSMQCNNRKCGKIQKPLMDEKTQLVYCAECNEEIKNLGAFAKNQLKMNKQFLSSVRKQQPFSIQCTNCRSFNQPFIDKKKVMCTVCQKEIANISQQFKIALEVFLKNKDKD